MTTRDKTSHSNTICYRLFSIDFGRMVPRIAWIETIQTGEKEPVFLECLYYDSDWLAQFSVSDIREICTHYVKWQMYESMYPNWREDTGSRVTA